MTVVHASPSPGPSPSHWPHRDGNRASDCVGPNDSETGAKNNLPRSKGAGARDGAPYTGVCDKDWIDYLSIFAVNMRCLFKVARIELIILLISRVKAVDYQFQVLESTGAPNAIKPVGQP